MNFIAVEQQLDLIKRGAVEIIPENELIAKLKRSKEKSNPLIVKLGCDPSRPDLHIGHAVVLRKMRHFQELGHQAVLVIGDFTAMIGDPSGRNKTRPTLTLEEANANAKTFVEQAKVILDISTLMIVYNSKWLNSMNFSDVITLASKYTVARMLERDDFTKRYRSKIPISLHEFLYPLAQGMDSVELKADIELGGTDQKFNLLVGRDLQKEYGQEPQCIITMPLLEGTDGVEKMSKSYGNHIGLLDSPEDKYGKIMSISDDMMIKYFQLAVDADQEKIESVEKQLSESKTNPRDLKKELARTLVALYHNEGISIEAENHFDRVVVNKDLPDNIEEYHLNEVQSLVDIISSYGLTKSKGEARRLIKQNAVKLNGKVCHDINHLLYKGETVVIKVGKRRFLKVK